MTLMLTKSTIATVVFLVASISLCHAFAPQPSLTTSIIRTQLSSSAESPSFFDNIVNSVTTGYETFQKAKDEGYDFKQSIAIALAGDYDEESVKAMIQDDIESSPVIMFTWEASPACKKAIKYLDIACAKYKIVRLDNPWSQGNPIRAELGKRVGRSSVPCIFVGGEYVGGFDGGVSEQSPGILEMAFKGTLRDKLREVGAL